MLDTSWLRPLHEFVCRFERTAHTYSWKTLRLNLCLRLDAPGSVTWNDGDIVWIAEVHDLCDRLSLSVLLTTLTHSACLNQPENLHITAASRTALRSTQSMSTDELHVISNTIAASRVHTCMLHTYYHRIYATVRRDAHVQHASSHTPAADRIAMRSTPTMSTLTDELTAASDTHDLIALRGNTTRTLLLEGPA
jgi:hypothetical protein